MPRPRLLPSGTMGKMSTSSRPASRSANCGPGTLVTTRLTKRWRVVSREAWSSRLGGAKPARPVRASAPTACPESLIWRVRWEMRSRHTVGSRHEMGSGTIIPATRLPVPSRSSSPRTEMGTKAFSSSPSTSQPRRSMSRRRARDTTARTTSFTVPPSSFFTALTSARSARTQA
jgi:hypothetical protein